MLIGHEDKINLFKKLVEGNELRHAYLFFGDSQVGKSLFAKMLANFCERGKFEADSSAPLIDFLSISSPEGGKIGIEEIRSLKNFIYQTPFRSPKRFVLIDDAEKLTGDAQTALLKIVEEPPEHGLIIFIAHDLQVFSPPLLSRLVKVYFRRATEEEIRAFLKKRGLDERTAERLVVASFGRIGRALQLAMEKTKSLEEDLATEIQNTIINLWLKGPERNSKKIAWLLDRETAVKRYNLNWHLQRRTILEKLSYAQ
jgi:DNA polymerase-3 subunit delta'